MTRLVFKEASNVMGKPQRAVSPSVPQCSQKIERFDAVQCEEFINLFNPFPLPPAKEDA